jgi:hypothetical protein
MSDHEPRDLASEAPVSDGRIPPELRQQIIAHFEAFDDSLYDNLDPADMLDFHELLDFEYWEREAALTDPIIVIQPEPGPNPP